MARLLSEEGTAMSETMLVRDLLPPQYRALPMLRLFLPLL